MGRMADLDAELHELPDEAKDFMQGFYRGRAEGLIIGQEEGAVMERERIIKLLTQEIERIHQITDYPMFASALVDIRAALINGENN